MSGPLSFSRCTQITVPNIDTINFVFLRKEKSMSFGIVLILIGVLWIMFENKKSE